MRILWLCNMLPGPVQRARTGKDGGGLWVDHVLTDLLNQPGVQLHVLGRSGDAAQGQVSQNFSFCGFPEPVLHRYDRELEDLFRRELEDFRPDIIHIWGTEYGHCLAMLRVCQAKGLLEQTIVSIQGLCGVYARHYAEGLPENVISGSSLRDFLRHDNIAMQRQRYTQRGQLEAEALSLARHVIGRTDWDRACREMLAPQAQYHLCNETLREPFYDGSWQYSVCQKHSIFTSSLYTPVKGFHYLLEALSLVLRRYPDAVISVPGPDIFHVTGKSRLLEQTYHGYLRKYAQAHGLTDKVRFLGHLGPEEMKRAYLQCNVFTLPSTIENSPNSLGEAMLLGVPCAAADVGGVTTMLRPGEEGLVYQSTAPYMLAQAICRVFALEEKAESLGRAAQAHARRTHDPAGNLAALLSIYTELQSKEG